MPDTLHGTTIAFGTTGFTANITRIDGVPRSRGAIDVTHLGTTNQKEYMPEDLVDYEEFEVEYFWDQSFSTFPPIASARETITVTYPLKTGESSNATFTFSGFLTGDTTGPAVAAATDAARGTMTIKPDGGYNSGTEAALAAGS